MTRRENHEEGLIRPMKGSADPVLGPDLIMVMVPSDLAYLRKRCRAKKLPAPELGLHGLYLAEEDTKVPFTLSGPFLGAPQAVMAMEKMIALGVQRIWAFGWCGSLQSHLRVGDLVLPTSAHSEEGTSGHYPIGRREPEPDPELGRWLEEAFRRRGQPIAKGPVWSTDAPYRETPTKVVSYQQRGVLAVEMEMSALMTLAIYRAVKLAGLLVVSDELFDLKWHAGFRSPRLKRACRQAGGILLDLVQSLNR